MIDDSTQSANDSFYSKDTLMTLSDESEPIDLIGKLIPSIASFLLESIESHLANQSTRKSVRDIYHSSIIPSISIEDYLRRIVRYSLIDSTTLLAAVVYIDKLCQTRSYALTHSNIYRLILASVLISIKYNDDVVFRNSFYAKIGGVSLNEINYLEYQLLSYLDFALGISAEHFKNFQQFLLSRANSEEAVKAL